MAGICNSCNYFRANVHPQEEKPHQCDFQKLPLGEIESQQNCEECVPRSKNKGCCH